MELASLKFFSLLNKLVLYDVSGKYIKGPKIATGKSRHENPQKLTHLSSRSHPTHLVGKRTAQKNTIIDITGDSQVNNNFPYRWSPASLILNNYFGLFFIFIYNENNHKYQRATSKLTKEPQQTSRLVAASNKVTGGGGGGGRGL